MTLDAHDEAMAPPLLDVDHPNLEAPFPQVAFRWIIFDMDGTLVDLFSLIAKSFNYAVDGFVRKPLSIKEGLSIPGGTLDEQLANYVPRSFVPEAVVRYHAHYVQHFDDEDIVYPGIRRLLTALRERGVKLAVYTGADKESADQTLSRSGLSHFFETVVTGSDVTRPKPDPEGLMITMKAIDAHPAHTVYFGDRPNDVKASRATGIRSAAAGWGSMHLDELDGLNPELFFDDPSAALRCCLRPHLIHD